MASEPNVPHEVTAAIAHFGSEQRTLDLVADLKSQVGCKVHLVVVDDASPQTFPYVEGVEVLRHDTNLGFGAAINTAADRAAAEWLLVLNNDVRLAPDFLRSAITRATVWQPAICGFRQVTPSGPVPPSGPYPTFWGTLAQRSDFLHPLAHRLGWQRHWQLDDPDCTAEREVDWIGGAALLLRLSEFQAVGGFDRRFFMYHEEIDLQRRLRALGTRAVVIGGLAVKHEGGATTTSLDVEEERLRSRLLYEQLSHGPARRRALAWGLRGVFAVDAAYHRIRGMVIGDQTGSALNSRRRQALERAVHQRSGVNS